MRILSHVMVKYIQQVRGGIINTKDVVIMNFTRIEYFLAAAKYLNITKAASVLYITQPSLSKQISLLEDELGVPLFDRTSRALQLTPAGKLVRHEFSKLMPEIESIAEKVKRFRTEKSDALFVGCVESMYLGEKAAKTIRDFSSQAKGIETFIERHGFLTLNNKIVDGSLDAAFTVSTQIGKMKDIMCAVIEQRQRYIIMSADHKLASREEIKIEDLRGETFAVHDKLDSMVISDDMIEACENAGFSPKIMYAPNLDTMLDYIELTGCITFLDKSIVECRPGKLKYYPSEVEKRFNLICIWKKGNKNPALREFIKYLPESSECNTDQ